MGSIKKETKISGTALMSGENCDVTIFPSSQKGIRFFVANSKNAIEARIENVVSTQNRVVLANSESQIHLVEHFLAACAICGIDSLDVCVSNLELPILDGSSKRWIELFEDAGFERTISKVKINTPIYFVQGDVSIAILPSDELSITYLMDLNHPDLKQKWVNTNLENPQEIIEARTFGYLKDLEKFQEMGLAKGVSIDNTLGLTDDAYTSDLRSELEPIKHKILDLVGDLKLAGINLPDLNVSIIAKQAGHASHIEVAKLLAKDFSLNESFAS